MRHIGLCNITSTQVAEARGIADIVCVQNQMQVALAWFLQRSPNVLLIPGTSSVTPLRENLAAANLRLRDDALKTLNAIGR